MAGSATITHVLLPNEAELLVQSLNPINIDQVGSKLWWNNHNTFEKLNIQAIINATTNSDDFVKEYFLSFKKIPLLIAELIISEIWTEQVFPHVLKRFDKEQSTLPIYMVLFHGATIASLLETFLFYQEVCEESGDFMLDLIDFVHRKLTKVVLRKIEDSKDNQAEKDELENQHEEIEFTIAMKCISILKYITDAIGLLPLSAVTRILNTHDMTCLLVQILDIAPWKRKKKNGDLEIYTDGKWMRVPEDEAHLLPKLEGQVWLTLYQLLLHPEAQRKYEFNSYRKAQIIKLRKYLHEVLLDQLPYLTELQRFLENLSVIEPPPIKQELIIEQIPEIRSKLEELHKGKWETIAIVQLKDHFTMNSDELRYHGQRLASTYDLDVLEELLIDDPPVCSNCHNEATQRCSRCRNEWYCSRQCQVKHWKRHKELCNMLANKQKEK